MVGIEQDVSVDLYSLHKGSVEELEQRYRQGQRQLRSASQRASRVTNLIAVALTVVGVLVLPRDSDAENK